MPPILISERGGTYAGGAILYIASCSFNLTFLLISDSRLLLTLLYFTFFILLNCPSDLKLTLKAQGAARDQTPY